MTIYWLRFMQWMYSVLEYMFDMFLQLLGFFRLLTVIKRMIEE